MYADRRQNVAQVVLKATRDNLVVPISILSIAIPGVLTDSMKAEDFHFVEQFLVVRNNHSAFASRQVLCCIKAVTNSVAPIAANGITSANGISPVVCPDGVRGVFDDVQFLFSRKLPDGIHIT